VWHFGDGVTSTLEGSTHTYTAPGAYTVTLEVSGPGGTDASARINHITVYEAVQAAFSAAPTEGIAPLTVDFGNLSSGDYDTCRWQFGDGGESTDCAMPSHEYASSGTYTVTLTVSGLGGSDTVTRSDLITVYETAVAGFTASPTSGTPPLTVDFTNTSTGDYDTHVWDFGDGVTSTLESPTHIYTALGSYTVTLSIQGPGGADAAAKPGYVTVEPFTIYLPLVTHTGLTFGDREGGGVPSFTVATDAL
jgi:PKD repeat protein